MSKAIQFRNRNNEKIYPCPYYPIGSIYLSVTNINPGTIFGGTWEQIKDRFLLGAGSTYTAGKTGGAATHTLTIAEMPNHNHKHRQFLLTGGSNYGTKYGFTYNFNAMGSVIDRDSYSDSGEMLFGNFATGGGQAHNNMPPYLVVYIWKRVS